LGIGELRVKKVAYNKHGNADTAARLDAGFTLVELLVVLAIIGLIAALAAPQVLRYLGQARVDTTQAQMKNIAASLELYYLDSGQYPATETGLKVLISPPNDGSIWNGPYLKNEAALQDAWGRAFLYEKTDEPAATVIKSLGRDGKLQGDDLDGDLELKIQ
jgi:general secretion pathway protein G